MRARYTWHLRPPFDKEFDRTRWWNGQSKFESEAILYELARRHPLINETPPEKISLPGVSSAKLPSFLEPRPSLRLTQRLGMRSWPKLTASEQQRWKSSLGFMKGLDRRSEKALCVNVTELARASIGQQREKALTAYADIIKAQSGFGWLSLFDSLKDHEWEKAISQCAVEAQRQGYILIAVAQNLPVGKAGNVMAKQYRECRQRAQRARPDDWLAIIREFENDEAEAGAKSQVFARYRRVMDVMRFT